MHLERSQRLAAGMDDDPAETPVFDRNALFQNLTVNGRVRTALVEKLIALYLGETPKEIAAIAAGLARADAQAVRRAAHTIKSSSASIGGLAFASLARDIEAQALAGGLAGVQSRMAEIEAGFRALAGKLEALRAEIAPPATAG